MTRVLSLFLCLSILAILPLSASAIPLVDKGVKAGMTYSNTAGEDVDEAGSKLGFGGGAWVNFTLIHDLGVQTEFLYTMKGSRSDLETGESTFSVDYLEMPVLATFSLPTAMPWGPKLMAGPYMGINMRSNLSTDTGGKVDDLDLKEETSALDYGLAFGAGIGVERFSVDARYAMGLASTSDPSTGEALDVKNRSFSLLFGVSF